MSGCAGTLSLDLVARGAWRVVRGGHSATRRVGAFWPYTRGAYHAMLPLRFDDLRHVPEEDRLLRRLGVVVGTMIAAALLVGAGRSGESGIAGFGLSECERQSAARRLALGPGID